MIREKITYPIVKRYKSIFFWRECKFCNREFKRENGFIIQDILPPTSLTTVYYCCPECALTIEQVKEKILEDKRKLKNKNNIIFPNSIISYDIDDND